MCKKKHEETQQMHQRITFIKRSTKRYSTSVITPLRDNKSNKDDLWIHQLDNNIIDYCQQER